MNPLNTNGVNPYTQSANSNIEANKLANSTKESSKETQGNQKFDADAVSVQISAMNVLAYIGESSANTSKTNFDAQKLLDDLIGGNQNFMNFFNGGKTQEGFSLSSIGYEGKPISELTPDEAKELVSDEGFFGVTQTSNRVSNFAITIAENDVDALKKAREGIVQGFEEADKLFGGELPEISYKTQERTLELIDKKIAELSGESSE